MLLSELVDILCPVSCFSQCDHGLGEDASISPFHHPLQVSFHSMQTPAVLTFLHMLSAAGGLHFASQVGCLSVLTEDRTDDILSTVCSFCLGPLTQ